MPHVLPVSAKLNRRRKILEGACVTADMEMELDAERRVDNVGKAQELEQWHPAPLRLQVD